MLAVLPCQAVLAPKFCTSFHHRPPLPLPLQRSLNAGEDDGAQLRLIRQYIYEA